jgi:hypothetical protein
MVIGIAVLVPQVALIAWARVHPMRYYCWAPYDQQNEYEIETVVGGRALTPDEIKQRYRISTPGRNPRAVSQVTDIVSYVERVYRPEDRAEVTVRYRVNGGKERVWRWPQR